MDYAQISGPQYFNFFDDDEADSGDSFFDKKEETPPSLTYRRVTRSAKKMPVKKSIEGVKKSGKIHQKARSSLLTAESVFSTPVQTERTEKKVPIRKSSATKTHRDAVKISPKIESKLVKQMPPKTSRAVTSKPAIKNKVVNVANKPAKSTKQEVLVTKTDKPPVKKAAEPLVLTKQPSKPRLPISKSKCEPINVPARNKPTATRSFAVPHVAPKQLKAVENKKNQVAVKRHAPAITAKSAKIAKKTTCPTTPECLKRSLNKAAAKVVKSSEDIEMERIAYLRKEMTMHLKSNQATMKRVIQSAALKPISNATQMHTKATRDVKQAKSVPAKRNPPPKFSAFHRNIIKKNVADLESFADIKCRWTSTPFFPKIKPDESHQQNITVYEGQKTRLGKKTAAAHSGLYFTKKEELTILDVEAQTEVKEADVKNKTEILGRPLRNITSLDQGNTNTADKVAPGKKINAQKRDGIKKTIPRNTLSRAHRMKHPRAVKENRVTAKN